MPQVTAEMEDGAPPVRHRPVLDGRERPSSIQPGIRPGPVVYIMWKR